MPLIDPYEDPALFQSRKGYSSKFSVHRAGVAQNIPNAVATPIQFTTRYWDILEEYDIVTNYRFEPKVTGYYLLNARTRFAVVVPAGGYLELNLTDNNGLTRIIDARNGDGLGVHKHLSITFLTRLTTGSWITAQVFQTFAPLGALLAGGQTETIFQGERIG